MATQVCAGETQAALRVVVVDDDRDTVTSVMLLLREEGYAVRIQSRLGQNPLAASRFDDDPLKPYDPSALLRILTRFDRRGAEA